MAAILSQESIWARVAEFNKMSREDRARKRVDDYNKMPGCLDPQEYDCPACLNRGHFKRLRPDLSEYNEDCKCSPIRASIWSAKAAGIYERLIKCDFPGFKTEAKWEQDMKRVALNWAKNGEDAWLLLCGQSGCGKTHLTLAAVGYRIFHRNQRVTFLDWRLLNMEREEDKAAFAIRMKKAQEAEILFIDDLLKLDKGRTFHPAQEMELAFTLLNQRTNENRITVISTEHTPEQLLNMDEATGSRILHMAREHKYTVRPDVRKNKRLRTT